MPNIKKNKLYRYKIKNLELFGYHGLYTEEIKNGQIFIINIDYCTSININAIQTDNIENVVDYVNIISNVKKIFNKKRYNLLESLIEVMYNQLNETYNFKKLNITISKKISTFSKLRLDSVEVGFKSE
tara:strand:- start:313 stop:696 length:384 start_codon:yes stop_codon:yes gene_type:complete